MRDYPLESQEQTALIAWARLKAGEYPELRTFYAIPNGGLRNVRIAARMRQEGTLAGMPDLCLPAPRGESSALYIEMKSIGNRPKAGGKGGLSNLQIEMIERLRRQRNRVEVCYGWQEAAAAIENYLKS